MKKSDEEWQKELTPEQYAVCRQKGTERAFTGEYYDCKEDGVYRCSCCGNELFSSDTKFDSGTGWPSYFQPIGNDAVKTKTDDNHGQGGHRSHYTILPHDACHDCHLFLF